METELFKARLQDIVGITVKNSKPKFLGFLSLSETALAKELLMNAECRIMFYGGYDGAERVMLGCFPEWAEESNFPIKALTFKFRECDNLSHRDFLGSLMSLGIEREAVGDILVEKGRAVVFVTDELCEYIKTQITKIGRIGVNIYDGYDEPLPISDTLEEFTETVASERLDCVIASLCGFSRTKALEVLNAGLVSVNSVTVLKPTKTVFAGEVISVRKKGRFIIDSLDGRTKKNRIVIKYRKHIGR